MVTLAFAIAILLPAANVPPAHLPFIAPHATTVTDQTKCDNATVRSVDSAHNVLMGVTVAGVVTFHVPPETVIIGKDGKPVAGLQALAASQRVRIYYTTGNGARTQEIDLL